MNQNAAPAEKTAATTMPAAIHPAFARKPSSGPAPSDIVFPATYGAPTMGPPM